MGYDLGEWNDHLEHQAELAVKSEYWQTGEWCRQRKRSDVAMNTELRTLADERRIRAGRAWRDAGKGARECGGTEQSARRARELHGLNRHTSVKMRTCQSGVSPET